MFILNVLIGFFSGIIGGMGVGGGAILIPLIRIIEGIDQKTAQSVNLLYFIPTALAAVIIHSKNKNIEWKKLSPIIIFGMAGGLIGGLVAMKLASPILGKLFGGFLVVLSIREFYLVTQSKNHKKPPSTDNT
jgi:hypothetical protein